MQLIMTKEIKMGVAFSFFRQHSLRSAAGKTDICLSKHLNT